MAKAVAKKKNPKLIDFKEVETGDDWELFARDFLAEKGLVVEVGPSRGPDGGKDLIVSEQQTGVMSSRKFTWLVSCKNYATSDRAVGVKDETDIIERVEQHNADGFMGFYSTMASTALVTRLEALKSGGTLANFDILDGKIIERYFINDSMSKLAFRYFPKSYADLKPIQSFFGKYIPLNCEVCDKDVLKDGVGNPYQAIVVFARPMATLDTYESVHVVCKGTCDKRLERSLRDNGLMTGWEDISDLVNPIKFLKFTLSYSNQLHKREKTYSDNAHESMKNILVALSQRTLREVTKGEERRFSSL